jgi:hypothetical protein
MNFVIYAPGDYSPYGGGCIALHKLCHNIGVLGEKAFIFTSKKNPDYLGTKVTESEAIELCKDGIAIYPEVTCGNPFQAKKVMRWILYYVREFGEHGIFGENDLIYKFAPIYTLRNEQKVHGELRAMELNEKTFYNRNEERRGACYLYKKTHPDAVQRIHPNGSISLDSFANNGGNEYLADVFNRSEIFYSYDNATWLSIFAAMCGCKSVVVPHPVIPASEWYGKFPYFKYGVAYGMDELGHAEKTLPLLHGNLLSLESQTIVQTKDFVKTAYAI